MRCGLVFIWSTIIFIIIIIIIIITTIITITIITTIIIMRCRLVFIWSTIIITIGLNTFPSLTVLDSVVKNVGFVTSLGLCLVKFWLRKKS